MKILHLLKSILKPGSSLSQKVIYAGSWRTSATIVSRGLGFVRIIILARILTPEDFGIIGIALLMMGLLSAFTEIGFRAALVQKKGETNSYLNTAWTINLLQLLLIAGILFICGHFIAGFFNNPAAAPVIQVMSLTLVMRGFVNIGVIYFQKELEFNKAFVMQIAFTITDLAVSITAAFILRSVWALVYGSLASEAVQVILSYIMHPYRPRPSIDFNKAKELFRFGKWIFLINLLSTFAVKADSFIIGRFLGTSALGLYQIAYRLSFEPMKEIKIICDVVTFPAYSKVQDNIQALRKAFHSSVELMATIVLPLAVIILFLAPDFTHLALGEEWLPAVTTMQILAFFGAFRSIMAMNQSLFLGTGNPKLSFYYLSLSSLIMVALIYPLTSMYGISGTAWSMLISVTVTLPLPFWYAKRSLKIGISQLLKPLLPATIICLGMGSVLFVIKLVFTQVEFTGLIIAAVVAGISYLSISYLIWRRFGMGPLTIISVLRS